ncbi:flagellar hook-basal body protein [Mangrovibacillus cuniculi]|uniref:Flagellar hook-basal body protein n=1 Tax=Mangrovibacillus cuniculi TaxID=2593652 RepID=A0A7S8HGM0_9BACI|nr:flagellar hook-basal body protein [Mangrovibacillus cuniculi]QPC47691.1 flagellar hook-basal body protein [Mangrovibacillus cuniculi]
MLRGFYTAASGMLTQQRRTEMLTNNMANANTPGFKADQASLRAFPEMLLQRMEEGGSIPTENGLRLPISPSIGSLNTGVYMQEGLPQFMQGALRQTDLTTDIALADIDIPVDEESGLQGVTFFTIQNAQGDIRYTRNGNFTLDGAGFLTMPDGSYVLSTEGQPIQLQSDQFTVRQDGVILENNEEIAQLGIAFSAQPQAMVKEGNGHYRLENGQENPVLPSAYANQDVRFDLRQGYIERSNVDVTRTMTDMMTAYRTFEANQKVLQAYDRSLEKAVTEIGRIG